MFLTLGNIPIGPASIFFIFYLFVLHLKWDILLTWFDSTVFSMVNSFFLTTDGLYSREDGNRWRFPSLGLVCQGDILALRSFVPSTDKAKEERKSKLLKLTHLLGTTPRKSKAASSRGKFSPSDDYPQSPPYKKIQTSKKIQVGWQRYGENEKRYVSVRLVKGGGTREISVPIQSSCVEVLSIMKEVYFPDGMSTFGDADIMTFKFGKFKGEEVEEQFTLAKYIAKYKLTKVRLYLLTRAIDDNDSELLKPVFDDGQDTVSDGLLGTSDGRNSLREDQDKECLDSLRKHKEKEQAKKEELLRCQEESAIREKMQISKEWPCRNCVRLGGVTQFDPRVFHPFYG